MATTDNNNLDDFLGVKPAPWWQRYVKWVAIGVGVILLILLVLHFLGGSAKADYATETVERGSLSVSVSATGKLAPTNQVDVGSELSGLVTKVVVDVNDRVVAGQPLALIDPSRFSDTVNQSKAALNASVATVAQNQATLDQAKATLARFQEVSRLSGGRVPAKTEMDQAIADRDRHPFEVAAPGRDGFHAQKFVGVGAGRIGHGHSWVGCVVGACGTVLLSQPPPRAR